MDLPEQSPSHQRNFKTTILIADDDSAILSLVAEVLREHEFRVVTACDGAQALDRAREDANQIDLLLTDFEMPHMDGLQLAAAIRQFQPRIGVVLMSGSPKLEAASGVCSIFLRKPFTPRLLLETITGLLGDSQPGSL
jgi:two-component system cell cycle sensor histidine kinase/response regulator CckA